MRAAWLLRADGARVRRLTRPLARELSDEAPRFSRDGRWILFVRTRVTSVGRSAISHDTIELVRAAGASAVPIIDIASSGLSYYDHFDWPEEIDWHQPRYLDAGDHAIVFVVGVPDARRGVRSLVPAATWRRRRPHAVLPRPAPADGDR